MLLENITQNTFDRTATYQELLAIQPHECGEKMVSIKHVYPGLICAPVKPGPNTFETDFMWARERVLKRLLRVGKKITQVRPDHSLYLLEAFRSPITQQEFFDREFVLMQKRFPTLSTEELTEKTHQFIAYPPIAGHPTGGAIDVTIIDENGKPLDMGSKYDDFEDPKIKTHAEGLTLAQRQNRFLLHDVLLAQDFAPFYGEWWHFSFGDREWAWFFKREAQYGPVSMIDFAV